MNLRTTNEGFSALELLIVIVAIVVLAGFLLPMMAKSKGDAKRQNCVRNLRSLGIGFRLWANARNGMYPTYHETNAAWNYFQMVGQEEIGSGHVLLCPEDSSTRQPASDFETPPALSSFSSIAFQNNALSYFYGVDTSEDKPGMFLSGDRSVSTNGSIVSGMLTLDTNTPVRWARGLHAQGGNLGLADGSVAQLNDTRIREYVRTGTNGIQRLMLP